MQTYILVGAGGTGSLLYRPLIHYLRAYHRNNETDCQLAVIDGDSIEPKNLDRQLFDANRIEQNKAIALVQSVETPLKVTAVPKYLGEENLDLIRDGDIVIIAADNYKVRAWIETRGLQLDNITVINGGNEKSDGSLQIWTRRNGENLTPYLSWDHPEIVNPDAPDRATMTCEAAAQLPGSEQTIAANMASASNILNALSMYHTHDEVPWSELHFDLITGKARSFSHTPRRAEFVGAPA